MKKLLSAFFICLALSLHAQSEKIPIQVTDMLKIKQISQLKISPDGKDLLFMVNSILPEGDRKWEYKYLNQLFLMPVDGSAKPRPLTTLENASQPAWSPDGNHIVFVRLVNTKPQLFSLSLDGGEPIQLTRFRYGASAPKWSPDGKQLLFSANITLKELLKDSLLNPGKEIPKWPFEKPGFPDNGQFREKTATPDPDGNLAEIRAYLELNESDKKAKVIDKLNFQEESATSSEISFTHFFIMDMKPNSIPQEVTHGFYRYQSVDFTPDGKELIINGNRDSLQHPDRSLESSIYLADLDGTHLRTLLSKKGKNYQVARISPSGNWLAFQSGATSFVSIPELGIISLKDPQHEIKSFPFDRNIGNVTWSKDEKTLYFTAQNEGGAPVYRLNLASKKITPLTDLQAGVSSFAIYENQLLYVKTDAANPFDIYESDLDGKKEHRLSGFNYDWIQNRKLSVPEKRSFVNELGLTVDYWIMKPVNYEAGKKYPAILDIHGGPTAMWGPGESSMWHEFQYYCAKGYVVVYGNPRGSGGYGTQFLRANINDW
ncbi:MAG: S9 family peptidase, partial [Bacteroidota bacterium]|nr:S9 family peptidase [Bacteroidota bacterium]